MPTAGNSGLNVARQNVVRTPTGLPPTVATSVEVMDDGITFGDEQTGGGDVHMAE